MDTCHRLSHRQADELQSTLQDHVRLLARLLYSFQDEIRRIACASYTILRQPRVGSLHYRVYAMKEAAKQIQLSIQNWEEHTVRQCYLLRTDRNISINCNSRRTS